VQKITLPRRPRATVFARFQIRRSGKVPDARAIRLFHTASTPCLSAAHATGRVQAGGRQGFADGLFMGTVVMVINTVN